MCVEQPEQKGEPSWIEGQQVAGPPLDRTQDYTYAQLHSASRLELKFLTLPGIVPWPAGWKLGILATLPPRLAEIKSKKSETCNYYFNASFIEF